MGKGANRQRFFSMADNRVRQLREELTAINTKYNLLQRKHSDLKKAVTVAERRIKTQKAIIEELELQDQKS